MEATQSIAAKVQQFAAALDALETTKHRAQYATEPDRVNVKERTKFYAIDVGTSGAWLVEKATGEIFNIMAYGKADKNKKQKADLGNILTADPARVHAGRWNYLR